MPQARKRDADDAITASIVRKTDEKPPNILMVFSDEHNAFMTGYAGHPIVRTPNMDRLAREGVVFDTAYCNSPLCSPSRQSFMAGLYCYDIGAWDNTASMPAETVTWAHMLSEAGYETSLLGKMHFNGYQKMYGFDKRPVLEGNNDGESFYSWGVRSAVDWTRPLPYHANPNPKPRRKRGGGAGPDMPQRQPIFRKDLEVLDGTLQVLREKASQADAQPWAICASFVLPHPPFRARPDIWETYQGKGDLPFNLEGAGRDTCDQYVQIFYGHAMNRGEEATRRCREAYFSLITEIDDYLGRIVDCLEETGQADDTVVLYFSDHGEMAGEHGLWNKVTLLESSVRVPILARWPGRFQAGTRVDVPVSLVDLYPTLLDIAGVELPAPLFTRGHSLMPLMTGAPEQFEGGTVFGEFEGEAWNHPRAFVRKGRLKYVYNHTAEERLYDLAADPYEMADLAADPARADDLADMRAAMPPDWDAEKVEQQVLLSQARRKIARCKNVCKDIGW